MKRHVRTKVAAAVGAAGLGLVALLGCASSSDADSPASQSTVGGQGQGAVQGVSEPDLNLIVNPTFDEDRVRGGENAQRGSGWVVIGQMQRSSTRSLVGDYALNWYPGANGIETGSGGVLRQLIEIPETGYYTFEYWMLVDEGDWLLVQTVLEFTDENFSRGSVDGERAIDVEEEIFVQDSWQHFQWTDMCFEAGDRILIGFRAHATASRTYTSGAVDNFSLTRTHESETCGS